MSGKARDSRARVLDLLDAQSDLSLAGHAAVHGARLADLRHAEIAAEAIDTTLASRENGLRRWLSDGTDGFDPGLLRMFLASIDDGRERQVAAVAAVAEAAEQSEESRQALFAALSKRAKLREIRKRHLGRQAQRQAALECNERDELWAQTRRTP